MQQLCEMNLGWDDSIPEDLDSSLPPDVFFQADEYRRSWRAVQLLADLFWRRWMKEYLPLLQRRQKWLQPQRNLKVGDLVLVCDEHSKRGAWPKAIVEETFPDGDGTVRRARARIRTASTEYLRDVRKLCLLEARDWANDSRCDRCYCLLRFKFMASSQAATQTWCFVEQ